MSPLSSLDRRRRLAEIMDEPDLERQRHFQALRGLERINGASGSAGILWPSLARLARAFTDRPVRVLDLATGAGDVPIRLWRRAQRAGLALTLDACDRSPQAIDYARDRAASMGAEVRFFVCDALAEALPRGYDAITSSLFLHHLGEQDAVALLRRMFQPETQLILVNDLVRGPAGYLLAYVGTRLLSRSPVVHVDGLRSVQAAFTVDEAEVLAGQAGLSGATVTRRWPCRYLLEWRRS